MEGFKRSYWPTSSDIFNKFAEERGDGCCLVQYMAVPLLLPDSNTLYIKRETYRRDKGNTIGDFTLTRRQLVQLSTDGEK